MAVAIVLPNVVEGRNRFFTLRRDYYAAGGYRNLGDEFMNPVDYETSDQDTKVPKDTKTTKDGKTTKSETNGKIKSGTHDTVDFDFSLACASHTKLFISCSPVKKGKQQ